ncbi:hypothetical protein MTCT_0775 [Methanothermobacter sp. CaT2]|jgi:hypothetical protein|uniref:hypothetical protein n=1 Tax=Methanothermobacter sp. CaT2 TaxID=866790 RepID=UPI0002CD0399|nr:hypothetical protein [Methanothermobacter sp. CaT2]BAM70024.1 hypothetical protein MTCT_0775 [Methanothermobacter sp. CaT2]HOQ18344.1 hypothetical protein [Methanothermobacter thermautotrophicus]
MSWGAMIAAGLSITIYLGLVAIVGEDRLNRFYERVTGEKAKKGGEQTPKAGSFGLMIVLPPFFLLWVGFSFVFAPEIVPGVVALLILLWYIGFVSFLRADTFTSTWDGKGYPLMGYFCYSLLVSAFMVARGVVGLFKGWVAWGLFMLSLGLFIATYYLFPDKMPGLKGNYLSTKREVLKAIIVGIILLIITRIIWAIVQLKVFHWSLTGPH